MDIQFLGIWVYIITTILLFAANGLHVNLAIALYGYGTLMILLPIAIPVINQLIATIK